MSNKLKVIAVTGGKGGIGKSTIAVNLSVALAELEKKVCLFDADFALSNVDILLGLTPTYNIHDVITQRCALKDVVVKGPQDVAIIPGASGIQKLSELSPLDYVSILHAVATEFEHYDYLVIDTAAGISEQVSRLCQHADEILVVLNDFPASLTDAYALIKVLNINYGVDRFRVLVNMSSSLYEAKKLFAKLTNVTDRFLHVVLHFFGWIPEDALLSRALKQQAPVVSAYPGSNASQAIKRLAQSLCETTSVQHTPRFAQLK